MLLVLCLVMWGGVWWYLMATDPVMVVEADQTIPDPPAAVWVEPGGSYWAIAREWYPHKDPREAVDAIRAMNPEKLPQDLRPGDKIVMPGQL